MKKTIVENPKPVRTQEYSSGIVYGNGIMEAIPTSEGYVKNTVTGGSNVFNYVFNYADHLGNVRLSYTKNQSTGALTILEENNYYPFGLKHKNYNASERIYNKNGLGIPPSNVCAACPVAYKYNYKYNGKELQEDLGLNMYDMDFRDYDPAIARWVVIDPVVHHSLSPYNAFDNNPVFWADPSGADAIMTDSAITFTGADAGAFFNAFIGAMDGESTTFTIGGTFYDLTSEGNFDGSGDNEKGKGKNGEKYVQPENIPAPKSLPGFPGAKRLVKRKGERQAWRLPDGSLAEWDYQHSEVEVYDKTGKKHKGAFDPDTGEKKEEGKPNRKADRAKFEVNFEPLIPAYFPVIKVQPPTPAQTATLGSILLITLMVLLIPIGI